jgi:hypothetical protein
MNSLPAAGESNIDAHESAVRQAMEGASAQASSVPPGRIHKVPTDQQLIPPGEVVQLSVKAPTSGTLRAVMLGPGALGRKLYVGKERREVPENIVSWRPNVPVGGGKFLIITVENISEEPAIFQALFLIEEDPNTRRVEIVEPESGEPIAPPSVTAGLTQAMPPEPKTTPADHGATPGGNEVAIVMMRNDASYLLSNLRYREPLPDNVRHGLIRRLDTVMKQAAKPKGPQPPRIKGNPRHRPNQQRKR